MSTQWTKEYIQEQLGSIYGASALQYAHVYSILLRMRDELTAERDQLRAELDEIAERKGRLGRAYDQIVAERDQLQALLHSQIETCNALEMEYASIVEYARRLYAVANQYVDSDLVTVCAEAPAVVTQGVTED